MLNAIDNMPIWKPAMYSDDTKVQQGFVLLLGNPKNHNTHLVNIKKRDIMD